MLGGSVQLRTALRAKKNPSLPPVGVSARLLVRRLSATAAAQWAEDRPSLSLLSQNPRAESSRSKSDGSVRVRLRNGQRIAPPFPAEPNGAKGRNKPRLIGAADWEGSVWCSKRPAELGGKSTHPICPALALFAGVGAPPPFVLPQTHVYGKKGKPLECNRGPGGSDL